MPDNNQRGVESEAPEKPEAPATETQEGQEPQGEEGKGDPAPKKTEGEEEKVTITKSEYNRLNAKNRVDNKPPKVKTSTPKKPFSFEYPPENDKPSVDELAIKDREEYANLKMSIAEMVTTSEVYQKVLKNDKTLARVLKNNPLSLLDDTPIDANDALQGIINYLEERSKDFTDTTPPKDTTVDKKAPQPAPQQPKENKAEDTDKIPNQAQGLEGIEKGLASKIKVGGN